MIKMNEKKIDKLILISSIFWLSVVILCWINYGILHVISFVLVSLIITIYFIVANIRNQQIGFMKPILFPMLTAVAFWIAAFSIAFYTQGKTTYYILGLHPGQFWVILLQWIGTFASLTLFYTVSFDKHYLSDADWDRFLQEVADVKKKTKGVK